MSAKPDLEMKRFEKRTPKSKAIFADARVDAPFGVHSNYRYSEPYPLYFTRAKGARLWDVDGNKYSDYNMGFGVLVAGHSHPAVISAIKEQAVRGTEFGYEWEETPKLARMICDRFDEAANAIRLFNGIGLLNPKQMKFGKTKISPLSVLLRLLPSQSQIAGKIHGGAGVLVEVRGEKSGEQQVARSYVMMTHNEAYEKHKSNATSYLTGTPTAICAMMLAQGCVENRGVMVPECLNAQQFLDEAPRYDLRIQLEKTEGGK
jgi:hypothetical protein